MSKDDYDDDVPSHRDSSESFRSDGSGRLYSRASEEAFEAAAEERKQKTGVLGPDPIVLMKDRVINLEGENAVIVIIDDTGSMGGDTLILRDKMPMAWGNITGAWDNSSGYLGPCPIILGFVGDAHSDEYPLQMIDPMMGGDLHTEMLKLFKEGNGGEPWNESYNLMAYAILKSIRVKTKNKPFLFFLADEGFYEKTTAKEINEFVGGQAGNMDSFEIFRELQKTYHVILIHRKYGNGERDKLIVEQWGKAIGPQSIIKLKKPNAVADDILGAIALISGVRDLEGYIADMVKRGQEPERINEVVEALRPICEMLGLEKPEEPDKTTASVVRKRRAREAISDE